MAARHPAVLLVEDDARLGAMVAEYLGQHELDVTVVPDGERGLTALRRGRFDVVLLDVMLPGMDGLEVCRRIRAAPEWSALPILMLTARGEDVDKIVRPRAGRRRLPGQALQSPRAAGAHPRGASPRRHAAERRALQPPAGWSWTSTRAT